jgi:hypothetical protein
MVRRYGFILASKRKAFIHDGQNEQHWDYQVLLFLELLLFPIGLPIAQEELTPIK